MSVRYGKAQMTEGTEGEGKKVGTTAGHVLT